MENPAWQPSAATIRAAKLTAFTDWLAAERGMRFADYDALWRWSVEDLEGFCGAVWDYFAIPAATPRTAVLTDARMPGAQWFPGVTMNYVDQVFRHEAARVAQSVFGIDLVAEIRHVDDDQGARGAALDRLGVMEHVLHRDGKCAVVAQLGHADGVSHEYDVHARFLGQARGREVIGRQHRDLEALPFHVKEGCDGNRLYLIGHGTTF